MHPQSPTRYLKKLSDHCGLPDLRPHKLRHTAATLLYQQGDVGLLEISEILGHASVGTTQIYTHITGETTRSALEEISSVLVD